MLSMEKAHRSLFEVVSTRERNKLRIKNKKMDLSIFKFMHEFLGNSNCQYDTHMITKLHKYDGWQT